MLQSQLNAEKRPDSGLIIAHLEELRSNRPSIVLANGKTAKAGETIRKIIAASREVFTELGHAGLTQRDVADAAGIAVGNLTYHFPTKRSLLEAMLYETLSDYVEEHLHLYAANRDKPLLVLLDVMEAYVRNARHSHRFFFHMWGYAACDEEANATVRYFYRANGRFIYFLVRAANPKLDHIQVRRATLQISSLEEGYKLFIGVVADDNTAIAAAEHDIRILIEKIVMNAEL